MRRFGRDDGGQVIALVALGMPLFLAVVLLVVDGGRFFLAREELLNAARLAAEAGASMGSDAPGATRYTAAGERKVCDTLAEALRRNLGPSGYAATARIHADRASGVFVVAVTLDRPFRASVQALAIPLRVEAAARIGQPPKAAVALPAAVPC
jgi:uncharacterized membrane protein